MKLIMIHSFKGGSGKTLFSVNVAEELAAQGNKVLLVETDFTMPVFHSIFSDIGPDIYINNFLEGQDTNLNNYTYAISSNENLNVIFADPQYNPSQKVFSQDQSWFLNKIVQLKKAIESLEYDFILFDTTPGSTLFMINLLLFTNHIFIMLRMDNQSIDGSIRLIDEIYSKTINLGKDVSVDIIFNQIPKVEQIKPVVD